MAKVPSFSGIFEGIYGIFGYVYISKLKTAQPWAQACYITMCTIKSWGLSLAWVWPEQGDFPHNRWADTDISKMWSVKGSPQCIFVWKVTEMSLVRPPNVQCWLCGCKTCLKQRAGNALLFYSDSINTASVQAQVVIVAQDYRGVIVKHY